ncbi:hypothetical protein [Flavobacterium bizetiae]|uniref:hypothetical protein n=1 Tax=Flavobacterium bizetiae TaxID=2704140 RepID=UPI0017486001|nr:hypothetical protein [Flavobacterium bizetiae]CAD5340799.1 hypothetical protein FLA105535_00755 [Flavobacterium bizetiae]CAD5349865.1 hypothetical protein FLA105534_03852 [Flavobacterium bizetiae]
MSKIKNYFLYTVFILFTVFGVYLLIDSFINPELEFPEVVLVKKRIKYINSILFFGGLGCIYYLIKERKIEINKNTFKTNITMLFGCLIFVLNCLFLVLHPEEFKKGNKLIKMIIGYTGILFFGAGLLMSVFRLIKNLSKTN